MQGYDYPINTIAPKKYANCFPILGTHAVEINLSDEEKLVFRL